MTTKIWTITIAMILVAGLVAPAFNNYAFATGTYSINADELAGETTVNPIPIGPSAASFYSYGNPGAASANTGLEVSNTAVIFLGEDDSGDVSLFVIYDIPNDGSGGNVDATFTSTGLANEGVIFLVKDGEGGDFFTWNDGTGTGSTVNVWVACCTDGFVLGTLPATDFDLFPVFDDISGIDNFVFLTQGETEIETITVSADAPTDMVISLVNNQEPECSDASPSTDNIWPPNHKFVSVTIQGISDSDGDSISVTIDGIEQDEELDAKGKGDGNTSPDGIIDGDTAEVRAERAGNGDGRVYEISFTADDGNGGSCSGSVIVGVPHDKKDNPIDSEVRFDSTS